MRNALLSLLLLGVTAVAVIVLLPVLGVLLLLIALVVVLAVGFFLAAPLLVRLPWFRDRIFVAKHGRPYAGPSRDHGDVIDVEGRELPEKDDH